MTVTCYFIWKLISTKLNSHNYLYFLTVALHVVIVTEVQTRGAVQAHFQRVSEVVPFYIM